MSTSEEPQEFATTSLPFGDGATEVGGGGGDETLASSNVNTGGSKTSSSRSNTLTTSIPSGKDLHLHANSSTLPAINTPLPSIHEHPATNPTDNPIIPLPSSLVSPRSTSLDPGPALGPGPGPTPSPSASTTAAAAGVTAGDSIDDNLVHALGLDIGTPTTPSAIPAYLRSSPTASRPGVSRRQSILPNQQKTLIKTLLDSGHAHDLGGQQLDLDHFLPISGNMVTRKIWVKRPGASATMVTINEDDLVDDVRDMTLRKYANSLGRNFDAPDLTLRLVPRDQNSRQLQPDEPMGRTLDAYYPGGQTVDDAILIDVPTRRTPKASPNPRFFGDDRPHESGTDYFPPYPPAPHTTATAIVNGGHTLHFPPSMAILGNGQLPPLPSPGGTRRLQASSRPKIARMQTASPVSTVANGHVSHVQHTSVPVAASIGTHGYSSRPTRSRTHSGASSDQSSHPHQPPAAPPMPTPPAPERVATPPPRVSSPRPSTRPKKKKTIDVPSLPPGMLNGGVPPINILIVEDNIINLKLLEAFVKRLKVRWQTAMNGREAVNKWRAGGFHLVLMDIQLPVMNGLEATREIRRIEKVNSIGVFSSSASSAPEEVKAEPDEQDKLSNTEMFKSPVIIVALTASSLQSDRHGALAAGCNDFLTKPVNFVWLERKVMEWGCMQALIDFDGWRKWKDFSQKAGEDETAKKAAAAKAKASKKNRLSMTTAAAA
ncbi:response regulator receiver domain-containing protein [Xylariales sp. AK1849]|nr:response regulator receiver domain-containing protein [Xylariales sp. AK1849]